MLARRLPTLQLPPLQRWATTSSSQQAFSVAARGRAREEGPPPPSHEAGEAATPTPTTTTTETTTTPHSKPAAASIFASLFPELANKPDLGTSPPITTTSRPEDDSAQPPDISSFTDPDMQPCHHHDGDGGTLANTRPQPPPPSKAAPWTAGRTTLTLTGATASLAPSDFFRLAPAGAHLRGWRQGLAGVRQARHPATLEAQGTYHLTFDTGAAAAAYAAELARLHARWRRAVRARYHANPRRFRDGVRAPLLVDTAAASTDDELARFALLPPDARLDVRKLVEEDETEGSGMGQVDRLFSARGRRGGEGGGVAAAAANNTTNATRVLMVVDGYGLTLAGLRHLVAEDGAERNMPWGLIDGGGGGGSSGCGEGGHGLVSVQWLVSGRVEPEEDWRRRFRFVVSFAEAIEAHRFVRSWHRKSVQDPKNSRFVQVNASLIW